MLVFTRSDRHRPYPAGLVLGLVATLLGAWLRWVNAPYLDYFGDETATLRWSLAPVGEILTSFGQGLTSHLYILAMKPWVASFGLAPIAVKAPSLVAGTLVPPAVYALGRRWLDAEAAGVAALMAALSLPLIRFSRIARVYSLLTLAVIVSLYWFDRALASGRRRDLLWLALVNALLLMLSLNAIYVVLVELTVLAWLTIGSCRPAHRTTVGMAVSFAASAAAVAVFYSGALEEIFEVREVWTGVGWRPEILWSTFAINHPAATGVSFAFAVLGGWHVWRSGTAGGCALLLWAAMPPLFYLAQKPIMVDGHIARFLLPTLPAHFLLMSAGLLAVLRAPLRSMRDGWRLCLAAAIAVAVMLSSESARREPFTERMPSHRAIARIRKIARPGDLVTTFGYPAFDNLIAVQDGLESARLAALTRNPGRATAGRLIILTPAVPAARHAWEPTFRIVDIQHPRFRSNLYVLVSGVLASGPGATVASLVDLLEGFVVAVDSGYRLNPVAYHHYRRLAEIHRSLALLKQRWDAGSDAREHLRLADEYLARSETSEGGLR